MAWQPVDEENLLPLLKNDHEQLKTYMEKLKRLAYQNKHRDEQISEEVRTMVMQILGKLTEHHGLEEEFLYPALQDVLKGSAHPVLMMKQEHDLLLAHLAELQEEIRACDSHEQEWERVKSAAIRLIRLWHDHAQKEEMLLFPMANQILTEERKKALMMAVKEKQSSGQDAGRKMPAFSQNPFIVIWEVTRACALKCLHCRAEAQPHRDPRELTTEEGMRLIDQIYGMDNPLLVFTGGDPLMRPDLFELTKYAVAKGLRVSMTPSATPRVTEEAIIRAKEAGLSRWAFSVDGPNASVHDRFRGTPGSYDLTVKALSLLKKHELPIQINTTVSRYNVNMLEEMAALVESWGAVLWSVFFLVPTGRAQAADMISADEHEQVFEWLAEKSSKVPYGIKTTAAPAYRRVLLTKRKQLEASPGGAFKRPDALGRSQQGVTDGKGFLFISHIGDVSPSGFLPLPCGNIRELPLARIYRESPVFLDIRNADLLKGKCGICPFRETCGGSRARAYGLTGDYLESDPSCAYIPPGWVNDEVNPACSTP